MEYATQVFPGLVHRDLKPENLLVTPERIVKITDFGLTKVFADFSNRVGGFAGTPTYMAPEQCLGLPRLDTRADVYALGVILYELLTGRHPFRQCASIGELFRAHLTEEPEAPDALDPAVPAAVSQVVLRCLRKRPEERYGSFTALKDALAHCYETVAAHPPRLVGPEPPSEAEPTVQAGIHLQKALSLAALGRHDEAMLFFDQAVEQDPGYAHAWVCKGVALAGLGRSGESVECFDRALALQPRDPDAWLEKARALVACGRRPDALECFDRVIAMHPWHTAALYEKGTTLFFLDRQTEAAAYFAEVERIDPGAATAAREACARGSAIRLTDGQGSSLDLLPQHDPTPTPPAPPPPAPPTTRCPSCGTPAPAVPPGQGPVYCVTCGLAFPGPLPLPPPGPPGRWDKGSTLT
jgi:tetratricopeptide (TPR) repeat protein